MPNLDSYKIPIIDGLNSFPSITDDEFHPNASLLCKYFNELVDIISAGGGDNISGDITYGDRQKITVSEYQNDNIILDVSFIFDPNFDYEGNGYYIGTTNYPYSNIKDALNYINGCIQFGSPSLYLDGSTNGYYVLGDLESESIRAIDLIRVQPQGFGSQGSVYFEVSSLKNGGWSFSGYFSLGFKDEDNTGTKLNAQDCYLFLGVSDVSEYTGFNTFSSRLYINRCVAELGGSNSSEKVNWGANDPDASVEIINSDIKCLYGSTWPRTTLTSPETISFYGSKINFSGTFDYDTAETEYKNTGYYFEDCEIWFTACTIKNVPHKLFTFNRCVIHVTDSNFSINNLTPIFGETDVYTLLYNTSSSLGVPTTGTATTIVVT